MKITKLSGITLQARALLILFLATSGAVGQTGPTRPSVKLIRAPEGGIQPQAAVDEKGVAHLIYLKGDPKAAELLYTHSQDGEKFGMAMSPSPVYLSSASMQIWTFRPSWRGW